MYLTQIDEDGMVDITVHEEFPGEIRKYFMETWEEMGFCEYTSTECSITNDSIDLEASQYFSRRILAIVEEAIEDAADNNVEFTYQDIKRLIYKEEQK